MNQDQINQSVDWAIANIKGRVGYPGNSYPGECLSLMKRELEHRTGKAAPASGTGYATGYMNGPGYLKDHFNAVQVYNRNADYPKGSYFFYEKSKHGGIYLNRVGNNANVFEQNADPDGSPAHITVRDGGRISHIITPKVVPTSVPQPAQPASNAQVSIRINTGQWNVRTSPEIANNVITQPNGKPAPALGGQQYGATIDGNGWAQIEFTGRVGYLGPKSYSRV